MILSCHHDIYGNEKLLQRDVIKKASMILPDTNYIIFDCWGHYVGHLVCLPIGKHVYEQIKKEKAFENYLTAERINDIIALQEGVFFYYSSFAASTYIGPRMTINSLCSLDKIEQKEEFLVAVNIATRAGKKHLKNLGMRIAVRNGEEIEYKDTEDAPTIYEIELNRLINSYRPYGIFGRNNATHSSKKKKYFPSGITNYGHPIVDGYLSVDETRHDSTNRKSLQYYGVMAKACPNVKCNLYGKIGKVNIVSNGTYLTKEKILNYRFLCKECGKSFCSTAETIFYGLRSPQQKILLAFKLVLKGISLRSIARIIKTNHHTVQHWLKFAADQSGKIDAMLMRELKVSQAELDTLWAFVKSNSLRQRAIFWKTANTIHRTDSRP